MARDTGTGLKWENSQFGEDAVDGRTGAARDRKHDPDGLPPQCSHNRRCGCHDVLFYLLLFVVVDLLARVRAPIGSVLVYDLFLLAFPFPCLGHDMM